MKEYSKETKSEFLDIIRAYYNGKKDTPKITNADEMMDFANMHQLNALLYDVLLRSDMDVDKVKLRNMYLRAMQVSMIKAKESEKFGKFLVNNGIQYSFFKGQYIRSFYEPCEMRSMGDIDIYIDGGEDKVKAYFDDNGYSVKEYYNYVTTYKKNYVEFEVHTKIEWFGEEWASKYIKDDNGFSAESQVMLTIIHTIKHIVGFGCGIRQVLDTALLLRDNDNILTNSDFIEAIDRLNITKCYNAFIATINMWFGTTYPCNATQEEVKVLANSIIDGGVFGGNINDYTSVNAAKNKSKFKMLWRMLFPSYERMCCRYPVLETKKYLLLHYYIVRLFKEGLAGKKYKHIKATNSNDNALKNREYFVKILQLEDQYYNDFK